MSELTTTKEINLPAPELVTYEEQGQPILGVLTGEKNDRKVKVLNEQGNTVDLIPARIAKLGSLPDNPNINQQLKELRHSATQVKVSVQQLWERCKTVDHNYSLAELLELCQLQSSLINLCALRFALIADSTYFQRNQETFTPRSEAEIKKRGAQKQLQKAELARHQELIKEIKNKLLDPNYTFDRQTILALRPLQALAAQNISISADNRRAASDLLKRVKSETGLDLSGPYERQAYSLLHKLGIFDANTNLSLIRYNYDLPHPSSCQVEAEAVTAKLDQWLRDSKDLDLTNLECITIDDITTQDMDDALSLEVTPAGYRLGIHIINLADFIVPNSALDQEAQSRASSVYLPDFTAHMFPEILACSTLSLQLKQTRPVLSVLVSLNQDFEIISSEIVPAKIKVDEQLDYCYVDQVLHQEHAHRSNILDQLYQISCTLEERRLQNGGFKVPKKDATIRLNAAGELVLEEVDENSPAHSLIGEMMILANQVLAEYAVQHNLPLIFRHQAAPDFKKLNAGDNLPAGLAQDYAMRFALKPSQTGLVARPHSTLGVKAYAQATSPIRRYGDLCNQRQLLQYLRSGTAFYQANDLYKILEGLELNVGHAAKAQRDGKRFWFLRYLQQQKKSQPEIQATVLRTDGKLPLVQVDDLYMTVLCPLKKGRKPGDRVRLKIQRLSPAFGELELAEAP